MEDGAKDDAKGGGDGRVAKVHRLGDAQRCIGKDDGAGRGAKVALGQGRRDADGALVLDPEAVVALLVGGGYGHHGRGQGDGNPLQDLLGALLKVTAAVGVDVGIAHEKGRVAPDFGGDRRAGIVGRLPGADAVIVVVDDAPGLQVTVDLDRELDGPVRIGGDRVDVPGDDAAAHAAG